MTDSRDGETPAPPPDTAAETGRISAWRRWFEAGDTGDDAQVFGPLAAPAQRIFAWAKEKDHGLWIALGVCAAMLLPFLGSVGLWDPWETHYGEVAREMHVFGDWWHPMWEGPGMWFFSKPIGLLWMFLLGFTVFRVDTAALALDPWEEWALRLPVALASLGLLYHIYRTCDRLFGRRVAILAPVILVCCPQYLLISKQAVTDAPFVAFSGLAITSFMLAWFGGEKVNVKYTVFLFGFAALAGLTKGLLGFLLPGLVFFVYILVAWDWRRLFSREFGKGALIGFPVFSAIFLPWYLVMFSHKANPGCSLVDTWKDQFNYLGFFRNPVRCAARDDEGKTFFERFIIHDHFNRAAAGVHGERGFFDFFARHIGVGAFPWISLVPFALFTRPFARVRDLDLRARAGLFVTLWFVTVFAFFTISVTKFDHYILPLLPPLAILAALFIDRVWRMEDQILRGPAALFTMFIIYVLVAKDLAGDPKLLTDLFVYNYTRPFPYDEVWIKPLFAGLFTVSGLLLLAAAVLRRTRLVTAVVVASGLCTAAVTSHYVFNYLSPHWSQKYLFETYYDDSPARDPLVAYLMNWRGETYYSRNTVVQAKKNTTLKNFYERAAGPKYALVEQYRYSRLKQALPHEFRDTLHILDRSNNKFYLTKFEVPESFIERIRKPRKGATPTALSRPVSDTGKASDESGGVSE